MSHLAHKIRIRLAQDRDVPQIAELYRSCYGDDYPFEEFYDLAWIKRGIYDTGTRWYVADGGEPADGEVPELMGSVAVMLRVGDGDDQLSEIGRLVVHPLARGRSVGSMLGDAVMTAADEASDFSFAECRTQHPGSQIIFHRLGFHVIGAEPLVYELGDYESVIFVCRISRAGRVLRRANPVVVPEAYELACHALKNCGLPVDVSAEEEAAPLSVVRPRQDLILEPMSDHQRYRLLRLGRKQYLDPDIFGAVRLEHCNLKLRTYDAKYLVLRAGHAVVGGLGYTWDAQDRKVKLFELRCANDAYRGALIERSIKEIEDTLNPRYLAVDVNAHSTEVQATLIRLGFAPCVYAPSMVFSLGERFDVIRFVKLRQDPRLDHWVLTDSAARTAELVEAAVWQTARGLTIDELTRGVGAFDGLSDAQRRALAVRFREVAYPAQADVFAEGSDGQSLFIVREGQVRTHRGDGEHSEDTLSVVAAGGVFGEMALIDELPRSASAECIEESRLLVLKADDFDEFVRTDPEGGVIILRNLARLLCDRIRVQTEGA